MAGTDAAVMLTLAGLTYRGFHDILPGEPHEFIVRHALRDGLETLAPVRGDWDLVWGPVTSRVPLGVFDSNAMYVVRHRREGHRYVVAIRGTNPVASSDWLFGDLLVGTTVPWPFATDGAAISTSTALGLAILQEMRARPLSTAGRFAEAAVAAVGNPLDRLIRAGRALVTGTAEALGAQASALDAQMEKIVAHWSVDPPGRDAILQQFQRAAKTVRVSSTDLRRKPSPPDASGGGLDLLTFLAQQVAASAEPLEVTVTGHSKGGALAQTVALWLKDSLLSADPAEHWDGGRRPRIICPRLRRSHTGQRGLRRSDRSHARRRSPPSAQHQRSRHPRLAGQRSPRDSDALWHAHGGAGPPGARHHRRRAATRLSPRPVRHGHVQG